MAANGELAAIRLQGVKDGRFLPMPGNAAEIKASPIVQDVRVVGNCLLYNGDSTKITPLLEGLHACVTRWRYQPAKPAHQYFEICCRRIGAAVEFAAREPDLVREITAALAKPKQQSLL